MADTKLSFTGITNDIVEQREEDAMIQREIEAMYQSIDAEVPYVKATEMTRRALCHVVSLPDNVAFVARPFKTADKAQELQCVVTEMITMILSDQRIEPEDIDIPMPDGSVITTQEITMPYLMANGKEIQLSLKTFMELVQRVVGWLPCTYGPNPRNKYEVAEPIIEDIIKTVISIDSGWGVEEPWWNSARQGIDNVAGAGAVMTSHR